MNDIKEKKLTKREDIYKLILKLINMKNSGISFSETINDINFTEKNCNSFSQVLDALCVANGNKKDEIFDENDLENKEEIDNLIADFLNIKVGNYRAILEWIFMYANFSNCNYARRYVNLIVDKLAAGGFIPQGNISSEIDNELILENLRDFIATTDNDFIVSKYLIGQTVASLYEEHYIRDGIVSLITYKRSLNRKTLKK